MADERAAFQIHLWSEEYQYFESGLPEQAEQMSNGLIAQMGRYVALSIFVELDNPMPDGEPDSEHPDHLGEGSVRG